MERILKLISPLNAASPMLKTCDFLYRREKKRIPALYRKSTHIETSKLHEISRDKRHFQSKNLFRSVIFFLDNTKECKRRRKNNVPAQKRPEMRTKKL